MLEEELKNRIAQRYFKKYDCAGIIKRIDFTVCASARSDAARHIAANSEYLLWAEAKQSATDVYKMLAQLIITIKQDAFNILPPKFLGCFDNEKISFTEYNNILPIYALNDFDWSQTPSQVDDKSVAALRKILAKEKIYTFYYDSDDDEIREFVEQNFKEGGSLLSTQIDKNNFIFVYQKWRERVMPSINADWKSLKDNLKVYDRDFFLAELNIDDNNTTDINDDKIAYPDFYITFDPGSTKNYQLTRKDNFGMDVTYTFGFKRGGLEKYIEFWKYYKRPPRNVYWNYIISRLDLLVPQDVRERKGAFFTPQIWVEKSQNYLADYLGKNWQDEYYIWDCCAGTGNLLNGLTNKYHIFASTLDQQDVDVMHDRINNGANLLENHVFQFDFLNDPLLPIGESISIDTPLGKISRQGKLPLDLYKIIADPEKRKKLVIYINPPYKEATSATTVAGTGENRSGVATSNITYNKYKNIIGKASNELFTQFQIRIYKEIPQCIIGNFAKIKSLCSNNFATFRDEFQAKLERLFVVPAKTFDNVDGSFPIGFFIWNTTKTEKFTKIKCDIFNADGSYAGKKKIQVDDDKNISINKWIKQLDSKQGKCLGLLDTAPPDFQNQKFVNIAHDMGARMVRNPLYINPSNLIESCIYFTVRLCIKQNWLNDRDQFLAPKPKWKQDYEFQTNCLVYTLFHSQNRISCKTGTNHWIPFSEMEVDARGLFDSHFMNDYITGSGVPCAHSDNGDLFSDGCELPQLNQLKERAKGTPLQFSNVAQSVLSAGRELWRYYHTMADANANASLYDIKEYFQGRDKNGKMKATSTDTYYTELLNALKESLWQLGETIIPKVYEYGFLI